MKRSTMVEIILENFEYDFPIEVGKNMAEDIMQSIEEAGMLPPTLEKVWMGTVIDEMNEWEEEE